VAQKSRQVVLHTTQGLVAPAIRWKSFLTRRQVGRLEMDSRAITSILARTVGITLAVATTWALAPPVSAQSVSTIELVPQTLGPYGPAEVVDVDVYFVNNEGRQIQLRLITLDFSRTHDALGMPQTFIFDTSTLVGDELYLRLQDMPKVDLVYVAGAPTEGFIITIDEGATYFIGTLAVVTPARSAQYPLDAINTAAPDLNFGARLTYDFYDRVDLHHLNGNLAGGTINVVVEFLGCIPPDCDDGVVCTLDECDPVANLCTNTQRDSWCDDSDGCTVNVCDGSDPAADEDGCVTRPVDHCCVDNLPLDCDDGIACTLDDCQLSMNLCIHQPRDSECDDSYPCTLDRCDPDDPDADAAGCVSEPIAPCCGDGVCESPEDACSCVADCGPCCGDGLCEPPEDPCTCRSDCGACCGDGYCDPPETSCSCSEDCGPCCGNGECEDPEEPCSCPQDCEGACCGDGVCDGDAGEDSCTCPLDCGLCPVCEAIGDAEGAVAWVDGIRRYRTEVLGRSSEGPRLIRAYETHAEEIVRIMLDNRDLRRRVRALLMELLPAIDTVVRGGRVALTEYQVMEMHALLDDFEMESGPELASAIAEVRRFVSTPKRMVQIGWIVEGSERTPGQRR